MRKNDRVYRLPEFLYVVACRAFEKDCLDMRKLLKLRFVYDVNTGFSENKPALPEKILKDIKILAAWCVLTTTKQSFSTNICMGKSPCEVDYPHAHISDWNPF